jgi:hypothetical protein
MRFIFVETYWSMKVLTQLLGLRISDKIDGTI